MRTNLFLLVYVSCKLVLHESRQWLEHIEYCYWIKNKTKIWYINYAMYQFLIPIPNSAKEELSENVVKQFIVIWPILKRMLVIT